MGLIVQKFGGTSLGTPERISAAASRIAETKASGDNIVVVVSAMGKATDELIDLAHKISKNPPHREMDMLLSVGERVSMALLSMALAELKVPAVSFTGSQTGIITDSSHRSARIQTILGTRVKEALSAGKVTIVAGFQGVSAEKEITTLGRGGSDTTAVALASRLGARICEIFTDVDGVFSADPRVVPEARLWKRIPTHLMVEMAVRGAGVLHPRSVELAAQFGVNLWVKNSLNRTEGTNVITLDPKGMEEFSVTGVTADHGKLPVQIHLARPTALGAVLDFAAEMHLTVLAPSFAEGNVRFFTDRDALGEWNKGIGKLVSEGFVKEFFVDTAHVPVSVIGTRFSQDGAALSKLIDVLARNHIFVTIGSASALAVTLSVPANHADDAVRALHKELIGPET